MLGPLVTRDTELQAPGAGGGRAGRKAMGWGVCWDMACPCPRRTHNERQTKDKWT